MKHHFFGFGLAKQKDPSSVSSKAIVTIVSIALFVIVGFSSVAFLLRQRPFLFDRDDPLGYYVYLRSLVHDRDFDFSNEYDFFLRNGGSVNFSFNRPNPTTGRADNQYTVGLPLLCMPFYVIMNQVFAYHYPESSSGEHFPWFLDQLIFSFGSLLIGVVGIWFSFRFCCFFFPGPQSLAATVLFTMCTPVIYYLIREPFHSHLASIFSVSLFLYLWRKLTTGKGFQFLFLGMAAGIVAMVRQQDVLVFLLPTGLFLVSQQAFKQNLRRKSIVISALMIGFVSTFLVQMLVWKTISGSFLVLSYGENFLYQWNSPKWWNVLFSSNHGLISWHPVFALCILGFFMMPSRLRPVAWLSLICFLGYLIVISSWSSWWQGFSFGGRKFLGLTPIFIVGLASLLTRMGDHPIRKTFPFVFIALFLWNIVLMLAYLSELIPHEGEFSWAELFLRLRELPGQIQRKISQL